MSDMLEGAADSFGVVALTTGMLFLGATLAAGAALIPQAMPLLDKVGVSVAIGGSATFDALGLAVLGGIAGAAIGGITRLTTIFSKSASARNTTETIAAGMGWLGLVGGLVMGLCLGFSSGYHEQKDFLQNNSQARVEIQKAPARLDMQRFSDGGQYGSSRGSDSSLRLVR